MEPRETDNRARPEDGPQEGVSQKREHRGVLERALIKLGTKNVTANAVLSKARSQLGQAEHPDSSNKNKFVTWYGGFPNGAAWCDIFQAWCDYQVGGSAWLKEVGKYAYTPYHAQYFKDHGRFNRTPKVGSKVFYDWSGSRNISAIDHIEIVEKIYSNGTFDAIGGNVSNKVTRTRRSMAYVVGFGHPPYGSVEEDEVPYRTSLSKHKSQSAAFSTPGTATTASATKWVAVDWDQVNSDPTKAHVSGNTPGYSAKHSSWCDFWGQLEIDGLDESKGDEIQVEFQVHRYKNGKNTGMIDKLLVVDQKATKGNQSVSFSAHKKLDTGDHGQFVVAVFPGDGDATRPSPKIVSGRLTVAQDKS